jgi:site-specific recombinase XerD
MLVTNAVAALANGHGCYDSGKDAAPSAAGITKRIGWHTFRHTFSTLLKANGEDVKVVQELLRHASYKVTMDTYTQAIGSDKRLAQSRVIQMVLPKAATA